MLFALIGCAVIVAHAAGTTGREVPTPLRILIALGLLVAGLVAVIGVRLGLAAAFSIESGSSVEFFALWQWVGWIVVLGLLYSACRAVYRKVSGQKGLTPEELEALEARMRNH